MEDGGGGAERYSNTVLYHSFVPRAGCVARCRSPDHADEGQAKRRAFFSQ